VNHALRTFGLLSGIPRDQIDECITTSLKKVGLDPELKHKKIIHLSGGMKQKLKFAQALLHNPSFLVLDEPMSGLDPSSRFHVKKLIKELHQDGITIFFSSHILSDIENIATRIIIIHNGSIMKIGTPAELRDEFRIGNDVIIEYLNRNSQLSEEMLDCIQSITQESELQQTIHCRSEVSPESAMQAILQYISDHQLNIKKIMLQEPNLEQVYLHYAGGEQIE
jgi:ABC-2 type transport system ATP-binding protein